MTNNISMLIKITLKIFQPQQASIKLGQISKKYSNIQNPYVVENINNQIFKKGSERTYLE
jgi:hypothetical protein